jgi:hypothetical protein
MYGKEFEIIIFNKSDIEKDFLENNKSILSLNKGGGYWLWKPYIIHNILSKINNNDILFYLDSKYYFLKDFNELYNEYISNNDILVWKNKPNEQSYLMKNYCKMDVIIKYDIYDKVFLENESDCWAGAIVVRKTTNSQSIMKEWLDMACIYENITDSPSIINNDKEFIEHRHDQSLLNVVLIKNNIQKQFFENNFLQNVRVPFIPVIMDNLNYDMENLENIIMFYEKESNNYNRHKIIYEKFYNNVVKFNNGILERHFLNLLGCGELPFYWSWYLLVNKMEKNFNFLEIGVYKGRILSLIKLLSDVLNKNVKIYGITPLDNSGDKFSKYEKIDYLSEINNSFLKFDLSIDSVNIIKGFSQDNDIIQKAKENEYNIIYIDGCHDYEIVCLDIDNYSKLLCKGGFLIMDDASSYITNPYGQFIGHNDVGKAIIDKLDKNEDFKHLYAVGHNRVWQKIN